MESKFTPGPWERGGKHTKNGGDPFFVYCDDELGNAVAKCAFSPTTLSIGQMIANAALCAAAPDLFEAIKLAIEIRDLWAPIKEAPVSPQHEEEMSALGLMEQKFNMALNKALNITDGK